MRTRTIDSPDTFLVSLMGYCGMRIPIVDEGDKQECRSAVAKELRTLRAQGYPVQTQKKGESWEVCEPEDCAMVPDSCGILSLRPIKLRVFECYICGCDIPEGESCNCEEPCEEEETEEESEE
jgi:hypothetical protein